LSYGQATIERGFTMSKELVVENEQEESLVARRVINTFAIADEITVQLSRH